MPGRWPGIAVVIVAVAMLGAKLALALMTSDSVDGTALAGAAEAAGRFGPDGVYGADLGALTYGYPPLAGWLLWAFHRLGGAAAMSVDLLVRLTAIAADLLTALLVFAVVRRFRSVGIAAAAAIVVSASPVLLVVSGVVGSLDPLIVMLVALSLWLLVSDRPASLAGIAIAAAASVSLVALVVVPVLVLLAFRGGVRRLAAYLAWSLGTLALIWVPPAVTNGRGLRDDVLTVAASDAQPGGLVQLAEWVRLPNTAVEALAGPGRFILPAIAALVPLLVAWHRPREAARAAGLALILMVALAGPGGLVPLAWAAAAALVVDLGAGLVANAVGGAFALVAIAGVNDGAPPWQWNVSNVTDWSGFEVRLGAVAWLTLLGVAIVGLIPTRPPHAAAAAAPTKDPHVLTLPPTPTDAAVGDSLPTRTPRIGILVVTYNAAATLARTLDRIPVGFRSKIAEIIVSDDASKDDTVLHGQTWARQPGSPKTLVIRHTKNLGYGGNQKAGYALAIERGLDIVVLLHGDGQYAPEMLPEMVAPLERGEADAVFGSRMMTRGGARRGGMPLYKFVGNRILTRIENRLLGTDLTEFHSGYRAYSVPALRELPLEHNTDEFDFDTQIIVQLVHAGKRILEIPIPTYYGDEISHVNGMRYAKDVVKDVLEYKLAVKGFGTTGWISKPDDYAFKEGDGSSHSIMLDMLKGAKPSRVLDIGCSGGLLAEHIRARGHYVVGVDYLEVPGVRDRVDAFHQADLNHPLPPGVGTGYDAVIAGDIIEHLMSPGAALKEIRRSLRPGGQVLLSVPNFGHWYPRFRTTFGLFGYDRRGILDDTHLRFFTRRTLRRLVRSHGFDILEERATGLPLGTISEADGIRLRMMRGFDRGLVRLRPTLFGYQFVMRLVPHAEEAVVVEGA